MPQKQIKDLMEDNADCLDALEFEKQDKKVIQWLSQSEVFEGQKSIFPDTEMLKYFTNANHN